MELNREQIIKVLEHCSNWTAEKGCKGCPYDGNCIDEDVTRDALSLINELTEENERLRADCAKGASALVEEMQKNRTIKADTVRKMKERLISEFRKDDRMNYYIRMTLDQIAKEMLEGGDQG